MGDKIRTAIEIAMEKAEKLSSLSQKEKEKIDIDKKIEPVISRFFKNELDPEGLWRELKDEKNPVLKQFQEKLIDSLTMGLKQDELERRKNAVLALENLKKNPDTAYVEKLLNTLEDIGMRSVEEKDSFYNELKSIIEKNPRLQLRQVESGGRKAAVRITVEEAINQSKDWQEFVSQHEKRFSQDFTSCVEKIRQELDI